MSNALAIATVTAALRDLVLEAMQSVTPLSGAPAVTLGRPEPKVRGDFVGANIYLFRVDPNAALRNNQLPVRDRGGRLVARPQVALDLHYLLTFYGQAATLEAQRLMALAITTLDTTPELTPDRIRDTIARSDFLHASDLDRQAERVRFTMEPMSLEDLSKLWTVFFQVTHELSVAYQASVLLLDADVATAMALPVAMPEPRVISRVPPRIDRIDPPVLDFQTGATVTLRGDGLDDPSLVVQVGGEAARTLDRSAQSLTFELPSGVSPGGNAVWVTRAARNGGAADDVQNAVTLIVRPEVRGSLVLGKAPLSRSTAAGVQRVVVVPTLQFRLTPPLGASQSATAWLNPTADAAASTQPTSTSALLRAPLPSDCQGELDAGTVGPALQAGFDAAGFHLPTSARVSIRTAGSSWTIVDQRAKARYWIAKSQGTLLLHAGLSAHNPEGWTAFDLSGIAPGTYLVRIQVGPASHAATRLQIDTAGGPFTGPLLKIPAPAE